MRIAILGAGNGGSAVAADLTIKGHDVTLIKTSDTMHKAHFQYLKDTNGKIVMVENVKTTTVMLNRVSTDLSLVENAELIIIYVQTNYHDSLIRRIAPFLKDGHTILIEPGYLSTAYFNEYCSNVDITIIEAESSPIDCRIVEPGIIKVSFRNVRNPLGVYPVGHKDGIEGKMGQLGYNFYYLSSVIEAALHNPNLIVHTVGAVMSIPRIEYSKGDYCMYWEVFTPSVWNILLELDNEKMNVLERLGCPKISYVDACKYRNTLDENMDATAVFFEYAHSPNVVQGPHVVDSRYITEDVSQGLVLLESLAKKFNISTPICSALIDIAGAALKKDFRREGRTLERLGAKNVLKIIEDRKKDRG